MKKFSAVLVLLALSVALVACGGGGSSTGSSSSSESGSTEAATAAPEKEAGSSEAESGGGGGGSTIDFEANPEGMLMFTSMKASGKAGNDTIVFKNPSSVPHNVAIEDSSKKVLVETETIGKGETKSQVELEPGTYTFFCSIPGHREAGMEGTLTIE